jgi:hypothetical protein
MDSTEEVTAALAQSTLSEPTPEAKKAHGRNRCRRQKRKSKKAKEKEIKIEPFHFLDLPLGKYSELGFLLVTNKFRCSQHDIPLLLSSPLDNCARHVLLPASPLASGDRRPS